MLKEISFTLKIKGNLPDQLSSWCCFGREIEFSDFLKQSQTITNCNKNLNKQLRTILFHHTSWFVAMQFVVMLDGNKWRYDDTRSKMCTEFFKSKIEIHQLITSITILWLMQRSSKYKTNDKYIPSIVISNTHEQKKQNIGQQQV